MFLVSEVPLYTRWERTGTNTKSPFKISYPEFMAKGLIKPDRSRPYTLNLKPQSSNPPPGGNARARTWCKGSTRALETHIDLACK